MNETVNRTPTVAELVKLGYVINVQHNRRYKVVVKEKATGKIVTRVEEYTKRAAELFPTQFPMFMELLPNGGTTVVTLTIPKINKTFYGAAVCRKDENYNKKIGVKTALKEVGVAIAKEYNRLFLQACEENLH